LDQIEHASGGAIRMIKPKTCFVEPDLQDSRLIRDLQPAAGQYEGSPRRFRFVWQI
jgi:hypothetical protein